MSSPVPLSSRPRKILGRLSDFLARKWKNGFYLYLAGIFTAADHGRCAFLHLAADMKQTAFDMMVRYRVVVPKPDPDIVIVDINEASLAAMAKDYGRWPWPRQVLGEFVEQIEKQQPKAVVFDILFSDPDVYNPDSDAYFDAAIAATGNTFFPMLRLDPADDALSQIKPAMIPGVVALGQRGAARCHGGGGAAALQGGAGRRPARAAQHLSGCRRHRPPVPGLPRRLRLENALAAAAHRPATEVSPARGATGAAQLARPALHLSLGELQRRLRRPDQQEQDSARRTNSPARS